MLAERYRHILWTIISKDYSRRVNGQKCIKNVVPYLESGAIIAFHDSVKCSANLFEALPVVLKAIYDKGLHSAKIEL